MLKKIIPFIVLALFPLVLIANHTPDPVIGPNSKLPEVVNPVPLTNWSPTDDPVGEIYNIGTTWYDYQHNSTTSRQIALDAQGAVHIVWMNGMQSGAADRHMFYNCFANGAVGFANGVQINTYRSGYTTMDVNANDIPVAFFHSTIDSTRPVCAWDVFYLSGAFISTIFPAPAPDRGLTWPHGLVDHQGYYHAVSQTNPNTQIYYSRSENSGSTFITPIAITSTNGMAAVSHTMANSDVSNKVAIIYAHPITTNWMQEDVFYFESDDGVTWDFNNPVNITNFGQPGHPMTDDVRAWAAVNGVYDANDQLHIAYTTIMYPSVGNYQSIIWHWSEATGHTKIVGETQFEGACAYNDPGAWHACWDLPCLSYDEDGIMYASWEQCTTPGDSSFGGFGNWDVFVSYSEDNGESWMAPVNITDSQTPSAPAGQCMSEGWPTMAIKVDDYLHIEYIEDQDAGGIPQNEGTWTENPVIYQKVPVADIMTDMTVTLAPDTLPIIIPANGGSFGFNVTITNNSANDVIFDGYGEIDIPGGTVYGPTILRNNIMLPGGAFVARDLNQVVPAYAPSGDYLYRIGVGDYTWNEWAMDSFPFSKSADGDGIAVPDWKCTGWDDSPAEMISASVPESHLLMSVSPNPFNPSTEISYTLEDNMIIKLTVFDITGREVAILHEGYESAGTHQVTFNAGNLASGVYFFNLQADGEMVTVKSLLLK